MLTSKPARSRFEPVALPQVIGIKESLVPCIIRIGVFETNSGGGKLLNTIEDSTKKPKLYQNNNIVKHFV